MWTAYSNCVCVSGWRGRNGSGGWRRRGFGCSHHWRLLAAETTQRVHQGSDTHTTHTTHTTDTTHNTTQKQHTQQMQHTQSGKKCGFLLVEISVGYLGTVFMCTCLPVCMNIVCLVSRHKPHNTNTNTNTKHKTQTQTQTHGWAKTTRIISLNPNR